MNDQAIEQEIQAKRLTAPRVTPHDIEANIIGEYFFTAADATKESPQFDALSLLTFCVLVLKNGFTVTGESACKKLEGVVVPTRTIDVCFKPGLKHNDCK